MRAIVNTGPGELEMREMPTPVPGPGQVRIRTRACGICATDLEMVAGWDRTGLGGVPGHEWCGVVEAVGEGASGDLIGALCAAENVLADGGEVGFEHPGGYGECFLSEAANVCPLPTDFDAGIGTLIEPLAVCVRAMRRLGVSDMSGAVVLGDGPIGLLSVMLLARAGVERILLVGGRPGRLALARELGATGTLNYHEVAVPLADAIAGGGVPALNVIEASGSSPAMAAALDAAAPGAKVLVVGDYGAGRADFPWNALLHRELTLIGSNASAGAWPEAVRLATEGVLPLGRLVTERFPADRFAEAIELVRSRRPDVVKVVMEW